MNAPHRHASSYSSTPYPGDIPPWSYCIQDGHVRRLTPSPGDYLLDDGQTLTDWLTAHGGGHVPLVAYGSNACPGRLLEKFPSAQATGFALLEGTLHGAVRVWSRNQARSGAVPLTIAADPAGQDRAHLLLIPAAHAAIMDRSEGRGGPFYDLSRLEQCTLVLTNGTRWPTPIAYVGHAQRGPLTHRGRPVTATDVDQARAQQLVADASDSSPGDQFLPPRRVVPADIALADVVNHHDRALARWLHPTQRPSAPAVQPRS